MKSGKIVILLLFLAMSRDECATTEYDAFEKHLLKQLGLSRRPVVDKNAYVPSATMKLYKSMLKKNAVTNTLPLPGVFADSANTVRTYINRGPTVNKSKSQKYRLQFVVDPLPEREQVKAAEVRFTILPNAQQNAQSVHVLVHDIVQPGIKGVSKPILRLVDSKAIDLSKVSKPEAISFDVTPVVERLSENKFVENHGIIVQSLTVSGNRTRLFDIFDFEATDKPLLMIYSDDGTNKDGEWSAAAMVERHLRSKRSAADDQAGGHHRSRSKKKICQRYPLYVDFADIEFSDWIQAPSGYDAYYCYGECTFPLANHMNASNHAVLQTLVSSIQPAAVPRACCVPTKLKSQTLLYLDDDGKAVIKNYVDMAVDECGCR